MPDVQDVYKFVRINFCSGESKKLILNRQEILNISVAVNNIQNGITHTTLFYDESVETGKELSHVIKLDAIESLEVGDTYYSVRELEIRGFKDLRLCKEPGPLKKLVYKFKWWLEDRKVAK